MTDAEVVQAFLVADEVFRRHPMGPGFCGSVTIRTDPRMPRDVAATGCREGDIYVVRVHGAPPKVQPIKGEPTDPSEDPVDPFGHGPLGLG